MDTRCDLQQRLHRQLRRTNTTGSEANQAQTKFDALTHIEQEVFLAAMEAQEV